MTEIENVTAEEAISAASGESILLDVREQHEWDAGHAPHAQSLPMSQLQSRLEELPQEASFLVICRSGQRSLKVATALSEAGYDAVNVLGGMLAWQESGGPVVAEGGEPPRV